MTSDHDPLHVPLEGTVQEQLTRAVGDLWTSVIGSGADYVVLMDRRRLAARVHQDHGGLFHVSWQLEDGSWIDYRDAFLSPREAAFRAYQGPH